ncbi:hypothetical protein H8D30_04385 [bacterium]|nr:hypothetical protein [bacterium]
MDRLRVLVLSRRLPPLGGEPGKRAWIVAQWLAKNPQLQTIWIAPGPPEHKTRIILGPDDQSGVEIAYIRMPLFPFMDPLFLLPSLVERGIHFAQGAQLVATPQGDALLAAAVEGISPSCPQFRWNLKKPLKGWPLPSMEGG